ncbi:MAG: KH domain-containing protein [Desulfobacteraceae bacterium]|nr:KH domain-containing protein [Desulfobacteraceae bacterium]
MTKYLEYEGKNVDQALDKAGKDLNISLEKLNYDVVSHGSSGIFGIVGVKKAKIRIMIDKHEISKNIEDEAKEKARSLVKDAFKIKDKKKVPQVSKTPRISSKELDESVKRGKDIISKIVNYITSEAEVITESSKDRIMYKVVGGNSGLLIGKRGQTLESMQYLVEKIINKNSDQRIRVMVDVEGYMDTRKANLKKMASRMADKAKKINKPVTIGQMNAYDRRIIHLHLKDNQAVRTQSVGEGYYRKLIIFPRKRRKSGQYN